MTPSKRVKSTRLIHLGTATPRGIHAANVPISNICEAMGHTIEVHLKSYARFKSYATADLVAAVNVLFLGEASLIRQTRLAVKSEKIDT